MVIFFIYLYILIRFTLLLSPKTMSILSNSLKNDYETGYSTTLSPASFSDFITQYIQLEDLLYSFLDNSENYQRQTGSVTSRYSKRRFAKIDEALLSKGIFTNSLAKIFNDIRKYRNVLVHSSDDNKEVNAEINNKLHKLYDLLYDLYDYIQNHQSEDFRTSQSYEKLIKFSQENALSKSEREVINKVVQLSNSSSNAKDMSKIDTIGFYNLICDGVLDELRSSNQITQEEYSSIINYYLGIKKNKK